MEKVIATFDMNSSMYFAIQKSFELEDRQNGSGLHVRSMAFGTSWVLFLGGRFQISYDASIQKGTASIINETVTGVEVAYFIHTLLMTLSGWEDAYMDAAPNISISL